MRFWSLLTARFWLQPDAEELTLGTHLGKPDDELHVVGEGEMLVIVQGEHGYVSERFKREVEEPMFLAREWATPFARGTGGIRLRVDRFACKRKLSQDKVPVSR